MNSVDFSDNLDQDNIDDNDERVIVAFQEDDIDSVIIISEKLTETVSDKSSP
jgi:hypothetical protein